MSKKDDTPQYDHNEFKDELSKAFKNMNKAISNKEVIDTAVKAVNSVRKVRTDKGKKHRPNKEVRRDKGKSRVIDKDKEIELIRLAEKWFFYRPICGRANISVEVLQRYLKEEGNKEFVLSFTHARDNWIANKQQLLQEYAIDKRESDWRAIKYLLTIADKDYSERKYLTDAVSNQEAKIIMLIKAQQLVIAKKEGSKLIGSNVGDPEKISLLPFANKLVKKSEKVYGEYKRTKKKNPDNEDSKG